jgi:hypothetical protein
MFNTNIMVVAKFLAGPSLVERPGNFFFPPGPKPAVNGPVNMPFFCNVGTGILRSVYALFYHVGTAANKGKFNNECSVSLFLETSITVLLCSDFTMSRDINEI